MTTNTPGQLTGMLVYGCRFWVCFAATGRRELAVMETTMNSTVYQNITKTDTFISLISAEIESSSRTLIPSTLGMAKSRPQPR